MTTQTLTLGAFRAAYKSRDIDTDFGRFTAWGGTGRGQPMVFLPGAQGTGEMFFKPVLDFADSYNTITLTYPAESDAAVLSRGLDQLLDREGLDNIILVGSSFGGYIAQRFAEAFPNRIDRMVIGNSFSDAGPVQATRYNPDHLATVADDDLKATMLGRIKDSPDSELRTVLLDVMGRTQPAHFLKARAMGVATSLPVRSATLPAARTLIIDSDPDPVVGPELRDGVLDVFKGAPHVRIPDGTHYPYVAQYGAYATAIRNFLGSGRSV